MRVMKVRGLGWVSRRMGCREKGRKVLGCGCGCEWMNGTVCDGHGCKEVDGPWVERICLLVG